MNPTAPTIQTNPTVAPAVSPTTPASQTSSVDPQAFKQAIQWAAQNPKAPQAVELQSRITSGKYNDTITSLGLKPEQFGYKVPTVSAPPTPPPYNPANPGNPTNEFSKSALPAIGNALISSEKKFGQDIAGAASAILPESMTGIADIKKAAQTHADTTMQLINIIKDRKAKGMDTTNLEKGLQNDLKTAPPQWADLYPSINKTALQVLGDAGGVALDVAAAGALKGVKGVGLVTNITKTAEETAKAKEAYNALTIGGKVLNIAKDAGKTALAGAGIGYGYDVTQRAQNNELNLKPGMGTAIGVAAPLVIGGVKIAGAIAKDQAPRIVNSLIGTTKKNFSYGKNPGRAIAETGMTANSLPDLENKVSQARQEVGSTIGQITDKLEGKAQLPPLSDSLKSIDDAMNKAASQNNQTLLDRLQNVKQSLTQYLVRDSGVPQEYVNHFVDNATAQLEHDGQTELASKLKNIDFSGVKTLSDLKNTVVDNLGEESLKQGGVSNWLKTTADMVASKNPELAKSTIISIGDKNLDNPTFKDALNFKRTIGDVTAFTGNPSDDKLVNSALKQAYGETKDAMNKAAVTADPQLGAQLLKANERYADFTSAEVALRNRIALNQGKNLVSMPIKVGSAAGIITSLATGGVGVPAVLVAVGAGALDKALASTAVKTRIAAWLGKESPEIIAGIVEKNPGIGAVLKKAFSKEYTPIENAVKDIQSIPNKEGGFVRLPTGKVIKQIDDATKQEIYSSIKYLNSGATNKGAEGTLDKLLGKYSISPDLSVAKIKTKLTALLDKTKTK